MLKAVSMEPGDHTFVITRSKNVIEVCQMGMETASERGTGRKRARVLVTPGGHFMDDGLRIDERNFNL